MLHKDTDIVKSAKTVTIFLHSEIQPLTLALPQLHMGMKTMALDMLCTVMSKDRKEAWAGATGAELSCRTGTKL